MYANDRYWKPKGDRDEGHDLVAHPSPKNNSTGINRFQLPIYLHKKELLYAMENYRVVILVGETGSGKSTQIPQILRSFGWTSNGKRILCTQPRRIAAISLAVRVAEELHCSVGGQEVGYHVRFDSNYTAMTEILYVTDGILLRETLSDPLLLKYNVIIVDDAHERSLNSDILLGLLKKIMRKRPNLRVIVTSATLQAEVLKKFFEDVDIDKANSTSTVASSSSSSGALSTMDIDIACILSIQGRQYPVDILYTTSPVYNYLTTAVKTAISIHRTESNIGDILVFLPSSEDCDYCVSLLEEEYEHADLVALPLYGSLPYHLQARVINNADNMTASSGSSGGSGGRCSGSYNSGGARVRRVIFSTNIAESSITIPGIVFVVDSGFVKLNYFDIQSGINSLICCPSSQAAATQRAGRAGRTEPGKCYRLMTEEWFLSGTTTTTASAGGTPIPPIPPPSTTSLSAKTAYRSAYSHYLGSIVPLIAPAEMQRVELSTVVLQLKAIGVDNVLQFDFISPPSPEQLIYALELLYSLGALDLETGDLTTCGRSMAEIGLEPKLSKCLLTSHYSYGCTSEILDILAMTSVDYPFTQLHSGGGGSRSAAFKQELEDNISYFVSLEGDHMTLLNIFQQYKTILNSVSGSSRRGSECSESSVSSNCRSAAVREWCQSHSLQSRVMHRAVEIRSQLQNVLTGVINRNKTADGGYDGHHISNSSNNDDDAIYRQDLPMNMSCGDDSVAVRKCLLSGYFGSIGKLTNAGTYCSLRSTVSSGNYGNSAAVSGGMDLIPHSQSVFAHYGMPPEWVLYNDVTYSTAAGVNTSNRNSNNVAYMRDVTKIDPKWIMEVAKHYYTYSI